MVDGPLSKAQVASRERVTVPVIISRLWAKTDRKTGRTHPLLYHSLETSAVASILWDRVLVVRTRRIIAAGLGLSDSDARSWVIFLAGVHDLGKATPVFEAKWPPAVPELQALGYEFNTRGSYPTGKLPLLL